MESVDAAHAHENSAANFIWVCIGARSAVFEIAIAVLRNMPWDTNRSTSVSDSMTKLVDAACFVITG